MSLPDDDDDVDTSDDVEDDAEPSPDVTGRLREVLSAQGVHCQESEGWLHLSTAGSSTGPRAQAACYFIQAFLGGCSVQLDVVLVPWEGQLVIESCGGFGRSFEEARDEAFARFTEGALPVLLATFVRPPGGEVRVEHWEIAGVRRRVIIGKLQERGEPASEPATRAWRGAVEQAIQGLALPTGLHWLRVFHAHQPHHPRVLEFLLDNTYSAELGAVLEHAPWPRGPKDTTQRVFFTLQGGVDVSRAVAAFLTHAEGEASAIVQELRSQGATPLEAEKLLHYLPQAFARTVLGAELPFPDTLRFVSPRHRGMWTMDLPRDPLWREALERAKQNHSGEPRLTDAQMRCILGRYPGIGGLIESARSSDPGRKLKEIAPLLVLASDEAAEQLRAERPPEPIPEELAPFVTLLTRG